MAVSLSSQAVLSGLSNPASLQFGTDGRLYLAQQDMETKKLEHVSVTRPVVSDDGLNGMPALTQSKGEFASEAREHIQSEIDTGSRRS